MPTEVFGIADSQDADDHGGFPGERVRRQFSGSNPCLIIEGTRAALLAAGWEEEEALKATASYTMPYGAPITTVAEPPVAEEDKRDATGDGSIATVQGQRIVFYDPYREFVGVLAGTTFVARSTSVGGSMATLVAAMSFGGWNATLEGPDGSGGYHVAMEAAVGGTLLNSLAHGIGGTGTLKGSPFWAEISAISGGGYRMRSTQAGPTWVDVRIYSSTNSSVSAEFKFSCSAGGLTPTFALVHNSTYPKFTIIANQFQFFIMREGAGTSSATGGDQQIMCIFPKMATAKGVTFAAVVAGRESWRTRFEWYGNVASALNGVGFGSNHASGLYPGVIPGLFMSKNTAPLTDSTLKPVAENCYLGVGTGANAIEGQTRIVGKVWDAIIVRKVFPLDSRMVFGGVNYQCVSVPTPFGANRGSLFIAFDPTS